MNCFFFKYPKLNGKNSNNGLVLLSELKRRYLIDAFDFNGSYGYSKMLKSQIQGTYDSWKIRCYTSAYLADKLTLYPGRSLVHNIRNDNDGKHCGSTSSHDVALSYFPINLTGLEVKPSDVGRAAFERFFRQSMSNPLSKIGHRFKHVLKRVLL